MYVPASSLSDSSTLSTTDKDTNFLNDQQYTEQSSVEELSQNVNRICSKHFTTTEPPSLDDVPEMAPLDDVQKKGKVGNIALINVIIVCVQLDYIMVSQYLIPKNEMTLPQ